MTSSSITESTTFQERMFVRVRESLHELLTAEEAKALVDKAIEESLFKKTTKRTGQWGNESIEVPSDFEKMVRDQVDPLIALQIKEWLASHHEEVKAIIQEVVEKEITATVFKTFNAYMQAPMSELGGKLYSVISKIGGV